MVEPKQQKMSFWTVAKSVLAAFFGVQSEANRQRDFGQGKLLHFIIVGLIAGLLFIITVYLLVRLTLFFAGVE